MKTHHRRRARTQIKSYFLPPIFTINSNAGYYQVGLKDANKHQKNFFVLQGCSKIITQPKKLFMAEQEKALSVLTKFLLIVSKREF